MQPVPTVIEGEARTAQYTRQHLQHQRQAIALVGADRHAEPRGKIGKVS